jgi:hypothetical protein
LTYTTLIPISGDSLGSTRDRIRVNFEQIFNVNGINHVNFNTADKGKHKFLQMPEQTSAPTTSTNEGGFYVKEAGSTANLFFRSEGNGSEYRITSVSDANISTFGTNATYIDDHAGGWSFLPGGLILQYGRRTSPGSSGTVTFPRPFPSGNAPFSIVVTNERSSARSANINNSSLSSTSFNYFMETSGSIALNWYAIGN